MFLNWLIGSRSGEERKLVQTEISSQSILKYPNGFDDPRRPLTGQIVINLVIRLIELGDLSHTTAQ